ncbi:MAG: hypothetical protein L3K06_01245 [Thermoplasmata archaeon]|nr:hypothetical protein [Thermoplasmata archaeon]
MVDWDAVEKARSKGWDWDRIAGDPKVGFHAESDAGDPGRALRALYYQRRSKAQRRPAKSEGGGGKGGDPDLRTPWSLARIGYILVPLAGIWFVLALAFPPIGIYFPAIPYIGLVLAVAGFVLVWGLLRTQERWSKVMRTSVISGVVLGLVISGLFAVVAELNGCPTLPAVASAEPQGWQKANAAAWQDNGVPVFFFYGSIACPYCSASSWAINMALERFSTTGTVSGTSYGLSNPNEQRIPEIDLSSATVQSQWLSFNVLEGTNDNTITTPPANTCTQQAYISAYDSGGSIPFLVINGQYIHVGTIVTPTDLAPLTPQQVAGQLQNQSGLAWNAVSPAAFMMEAFIVKANNGLPRSVATDPNVAPLLAQIT